MPPVPKHNLQTYKADNLGKGSWLASRVCQGQALSADPSCTDCGSHCDEISICPIPYGVRKKSSGKSSCKMRDCKQASNLIQWNGIPLLLEKAHFSKRISSLGPFSYSHASFETRRNWKCVVKGDIGRGREKRERTQRRQVFISLKGNRTEFKSFAMFRPGWCGSVD